jgi:hypothetical protein
MTEACPHCGEPLRLHKGICWKVKAIEYFENGTIKRVEYDTPRIEHHHYPALLPEPPKKDDRFKIKGAA